MDETTNSTEWRRVGGKGTVKALSKSKNCRDWELSVSVGKNPSTGKYEREYRRVHGMSKREAQAALDAFKDELRKQYESAATRKELAQDVEYARLQAELEKQKAAFEAAQANVDKYRELLEEREKPMDCPTILEYGRKWADYRKNTHEVACSTRRNDERNLRLIAKHIGEKRMDEITRSDVKAYYSALMSKGGGLSGKALSGTSAQDAAICLTMLFKEAVMDASVPVYKSPCDGVKLPRVDTKEKKALADEQVRKLARLCTFGEPDARKVAVIIMLSCGLRRGEVCALRWCDVDMDERMLHVRHSFSQARKNDGTIEGLKATKRERSNRAIPLSDGVYDLLKRWHTAQGVYLIGLGLSQDGERPVISNQFGGFMRPTNLYKWWTKFAAKNGIDATPHQLRHTFCTIGCADGVDIITMMKLMGQKTTAMIEKVDAHAKQENMVRATTAISGDIFDVQPTRFVSLDNREESDEAHGTRKTA